MKWQMPACRRGRENDKWQIQAFTLVELIITISIIVILAIIALAYFRSQIFKGSDARRKSELNRIKIAVEEYEKDNNCYPTAVTCADETALKPYIEKIPCDPRTKQPYPYEVEAGTSCPRWFRVYAKLENDNDSAIIPNIGPENLNNFYVESANALGSPTDPNMD